MIPYGKHQINEDDIQAVQQTLQSDRITQGAKLEQFESKLENQFNCEHAVVVNNGTTALTLAYKSLGVSGGDHVLTTPNSFVATSNAILLNGGQPKFIDINPETFNLSFKKLKKYLKTNNTEQIEGISVVHFAGLPCEVGKISELAEKYDLFLLEDACHAPGAEWRNRQGEWQRIGECKYTDAAVMSFHPVKHFTSAEGGAVLTNQSALANKIQRYRTHGILKNQDEWNHKPWYYEMKSVGLNGRMSEIHAALGISQLDRFSDFLEKRRQLAKNYDDFFENVESISTQFVPENKKNAYHLYVIQTQQRNQLFRYLNDHGIEPQVHYIPIPHHPYYENEFQIDTSAYSNAENYYETTLSLPLYPDLTTSQQDEVISVIKQFLQEKEI